MGEGHDPFPLGEGTLHLTTRRMRPIKVRHMRPEDAPLLVDFFHHLSPETRRLRFMTSQTDVPEEVIWKEAKRLASLDPVHHAALVALEDGSGPEAIVGVTRIAEYRDDPTAGEFAIVLRDDYQKEGLGSLLFDLLLQVAMVRDFKRLIGLALVENYGMLNLARSMGLPVHTHASRGEMTITIDIMN